MCLQGAVFMPQVVQEHIIIIQKQKMVIFCWQNWVHTHDYPAAVNWKLYASRIQQLPSNGHNFSGVIYHDLFSFTELAEPEGNCTICQQDLCCHLSYKMAEVQKDDIYVLVAFDGLHVVEGEYYLQVKFFSSYLDSGKAARLSLQPICICLIFDWRGLKGGVFLGPSEKICFLHYVF